MTQGWPAAAVTSRSVPSWAADTGGLVHAPIDHGTGMPATGFERVGQLRVWIAG